jgi:cardiolipin synthase
MSIHLAFGGWRLAAHGLIAAVAATHALLTKRDPRSAWGWIAVCWLFPAAGAVLYYLFGINRVQTRAQRLQGPANLTEFMPGSGSESLPGPTAGMDAAEIQELVRIGRAMTGRRLLGHNEIHPLFNGDAAFPAMLEAIRNARHRVHLSTYIFRGDDIGCAFAEALRDAQQRGVEVHVLLDGFGAAFYFPRGEPLLRRSDLDPQLFLPLRWFPPMLYLNLRNHRKLLIVDDDVAFTGGMNIADYHRIDDRAGYRVADLHFRLRGALVQQLAAAFAADWKFATGETLAVGEPARPAGGQAIGRVITDGPNDDLDKLSMVLLGAVAAAHHRVWLMTPYFVPDPRIISALQAAALRGVDVSVIIPARSNLRYVDWASRHWLATLLEREVKIFLRPAPFAHTKLFIIDDYVQFGSANLDARSLRLNFELMVEAFDASLIGTLATHFSQVRDASRAMKCEDLEARSFPARFRDALCWLFSPYL